MKERVIIYGIGSRMFFELEWLQSNFIIIGYSDKNSAKKDMLENSGLYIAPDEIINSDCDCLIITSVYAEEIKKELQESRGMPGEKLFTDCEKFYENVENNRYSYGSENADKIFMVIVCNSERSGLFSHYKYIITNIMYAITHGYIPVIDMQSFPNAYLEADEVGRKNAWEDYFQQPCGYGLEDISRSKNIIKVEDFLILGYSDCSISRINKLDAAARTLYHSYHEKYIHISDNVESFILQKYNNIFSDIKKGSKICGVLFRGTDYSSLKLSGHTIQPSIAQEIDKVRELKKTWEFDYIYLATESQEAIDEFKENFSEKLLYLERERFTVTDGKWLSQIPFERAHDKYIKGIEYLTEMKMLARCNFLIAGITCGTTGVLIMQPYFEQVYLFDLGIY